MSQPAKPVHPSVQSALDRVRESNQALAAKGRILLTVSLSTEEEAHQIMEWMYCKEKPMLAKLEEIAWDKVAVTKKEAEVLEKIREMLI